MKYIKKYNESLNHDKIGEYVYCKKTLHDQITREIKLIYKTILINFIKGKYYNVKGLYGDTNKAIENGYNGYLPLKYISAIIVEDNNEYEYFFKVNPRNKEHRKYEDFFEYFEIPEFTNTIDKYNL